MFPVCDVYFTWNIFVLSSESHFFTEKMRKPLVPVIYGRKVQKWLIRNWTDMGSATQPHMKHKIIASTGLRTTGVSNRIFHANPTPNELLNGVILKKSVQFNNHSDRELEPGEINVSAGPFYEVKDEEDDEKETVETRRKQV